MESIDLDDCISLGSSAVEFALHNKHNEIVECLIREISLRSAIDTRENNSKREDQN